MEALGGLILLLLPLLVILPLLILHATSSILLDAETGTFCDAFK